jgi:hypothetical protein
MPVFDDQDKVFWKCSFGRMASRLHKNAPKGEFGKGVAGAIELFHKGIRPIFQAFSVKS